MAKNANPAKVASALNPLSMMLPLSLIASPQARLNEIKPTPMTIPKRTEGKKGKR